MSEWHRGNPAYRPSLGKRLREEAVATNTPPGKLMPARIMAAIDAERRSPAPPRPRAERRGMAVALSALAAGMVAVSCVAIWSLRPAASSRQTTVQVVEVSPNEAQATQPADEVLALAELLDGGAEAIAVWTALSLSPEPMSDLHHDAQVASQLVLAPLPGLADL